MKCIECNKPFNPVVPKQIYCGKKCQQEGTKKHQYIKYHANKKMPNWICQNCGHQTKLDFFPLRNTKKWLKYRCPKCNKKNTKNI